MLLQIGAAYLLRNGTGVITNWGSYYKLGRPLLQIGAKFITNWGNYYKLGYNKSQYPITFMNCQKLWSLTEATLTNPSFQYFSEFEKNLKFSLRPTLTNLNFKFTWNKTGHILNLMDEMFNFLKFFLKYFPLKMNKKNGFSIGKNGILNPLRILCIKQNIWLLEKPCWLEYI